MILDELAEKFESAIPGCDLVCQYQAGIPVYRVRLVASVIRKHQIPAIPQFVLKLIALGVDSEEEIAKALGLEAIFIRNALSHLDLNQLIKHISEPFGISSLRFTLTGKGMRARDEAILEPYVDRFTAQVDGFTGDIAADSEVGLLSGPELRKERVWLLQAVPRKRPSLASLNDNLSELHSAYKTQARVRNTDDRPIEILAIERCFLMYKIVNVLAFRDLSSELLTFRVFEGYEPVDEYGVVLTRRERDGGRVIPDSLLDSLAEYTPPSPLIQELQPMIDEAEQLAQNLEAVQVEKHELEETAPHGLDTELPGPHPITEKSQRILDLEARITQLESARPRKVQDSEHRHILKQALTMAANSVVIISPWIKSSAVDNEIIELIDAAVKRGVWVLIGYGMPPRPGQSKEDFIDETVRAGFDRIRKKPNGTKLITEWLGNTHEKVLICDKRFCIVTSFNWLSYRGDKGFRRETGTYCEDPQFVRSVYKVIEQFESAPTCLVSDEADVN